MNESAMRFLDKVFKDLYKEYSVRRYKKDKISNIDEYMKKFEKFLKSCTEGRRKDYVIKLLTDNYVIKEENISYGIDKEQVISGQRDSLSVWINYLTDDTCSYPMWVKYWVFRSLIKIGTYDEVNNTWQVRSKKTLSPFIDFNAEALASTISAVMKSVNKEINDEEDINDEEIEKLVQSGSFKKLYTHFLVKVNKQVRKYGNEGSWIKYNQGTDDYIKLSKSLEGYNTGWCTARLEMSKKQICGPYSDAPKGGDFYVYYSVDEKGEHKIPRIAIRMSGSDKIGEIRGTETGQNLEEGLEDILETKLKEMSLLTSDVIEKVNANKFISNIIKKHLGHQILEIDDIKVIYELTELPSFGYKIDPRLEKIRKQRNAQIDFDRLDEQNQISWLRLGKFKIICDNKRVIMKAVNQNSSVLKYASEELKNDKEIVLAAVKQACLTLEYASEELRGDREIVLEAVKQYGFALEYASEELKNDREFMLEALKQYGFALKYASEELRGDREIVLEAVKQNGLVLEYVSQELKSDREIVLEAVKQDGIALAYASEELQNDREIVSEAVKQDNRALRYASEKIRKDKIFLLGLKLYELANFIKVKFTYVSDKFINECEKFVLKRENIDELEEQNGRHI